MALDQATLQTLLQRLGVVVGKTVSDQIAAALNTAGTDITTLQQRLQTIERILDADPNTPEFDAAQNIITTLTDLTNQINAMKDPNVAGSLASQIADALSQLSALAAIVDAMKASIGLQADGTIVLPTAQTDTGGVFQLLTDPQTGAYPTTLLQAVQNLARRAKGQLDAVLASVSSLQSDVSALQSDVAAINGAVSNLDVLVTSFYTGVQNGLNGAVDPVMSGGSGL